LKNDSNDEKTDSPDAGAPALVKASALATTSPPIGTSLLPLAEPKTMLVVAPEAVVAALPSDSD
jgi:hypothetical protein